MGDAKSRIELLGGKGKKYLDTTVKITIDLNKAKKQHITAYGLANILHHELRHAEINSAPLEGEDLNTEEGIDKSLKKRQKMDQKLDVYIPYETRTKKGNGVQTLDPRNMDFQKEIGLLPEDYLESNDAKPSPPKK